MGAPIPDDVPLPLPLDAGFHHDPPPSSPPGFPGIPSSPPPGPFKVLFVTRRPSFTLLDEVERAGVRVLRMRDLDGAIQALQGRPFEVVVLEPHLEGDGDGIRLVRAIKFADRQELNDVARQIARDHRKTPFVILPPAGTSEFAIFVTPDKWVLGDAETTSLPRTIIRLAQRASGYN